uniref:Immunoglobulin V-set domain-containing protein n=1 Tax=Xiphophorus couchianus TaxID=32473 RepID=A0A3B5L4B4_9TELE
SGSRNCFSLGIDIHQFPSNIVSNTSEDVQLFCSHNQSSYRVVLWYQKTPGDQALNLIGYGYGQISNDSVEEKFRKHFRLGGDLAAAKKNLSLSIAGLKAEHTATVVSSPPPFSCSQIVADMFVTVFYLSLLTHSGRFLKNVQAARIAQIQTFILPTSLFTLVCL